MDSIKTKLFDDDEDLDDFLADLNRHFSAGSPSTSKPSQSKKDTKTPRKKQLVGQKKPFKSLSSSPPISNKKKKTSGSFPEPSIEQLNDVTFVSGVNLREEEEQLLSSPNKDSQASEDSRRVVQEEEDRLLLQKTPLQKKLGDIMLKCGLRSISKDVLQCLSMCVEERLRNLIIEVVRLSKQRIDNEKTRHLFAITSDLCWQIWTANQKAREDWDKKQAKKLEKPNATEASPFVDKDKDKEQCHSKNVKVNKKEVDKTRTIVANVAARAAVGLDDLISRWELMAEQARQKSKCIGGTSGLVPGTRPSISLSQSEQQDSAKKGYCGSPMLGKSNNRGEIHNKVLHRVSVKDIIGALQKEPQMSKSCLIYRLYERAI